MNPSRPGVRSRESEFPQRPAPFSGGNMSGIGVPSYQDMSQQVSCQRLNNKRDLHQGSRMNLSRGAEAFILL